MIPKIVHKTGHYETEDEFPDCLKQTFNKNKELNPDYEFRYYNDADCDKKIQYMFGKKGLKTYKNVIPGAFRADIFRFCIVYLDGGIYSDLAQQFLVPLDKIINHADEEIVLSNDYLNNIQINFFAATKHHRFIYDVLIQQMRNIKKRKLSLFPNRDNVLGITGTKVAYRVFRNYEQKQNIQYTRKLKPFHTNILKAFWNIKKQKLCLNGTPVISYYSDTINKKTRSSNCYVLLYLSGNVYNDYKPIVSPLVFLIIFSLFGVLVLGFGVKVYCRVKNKKKN
mgnify:FL=1